MERKRSERQHGNIHVVTQKHKPPDIHFSLDSEIEKANGNTRRKERNEGKNEKVKYLGNTTPNT